MKQAEAAGSEENAQISALNARNLQILEALEDIPRLLEEHMGDDQQSPEENEFPILIENVCDMIDKFRACKRAADSFVAAFPSWIEIRKSNIEKLKELAKCMDTHHFNCNVSKLTASSVGIVGGIASIVGAALIPFTLGASSALLIAGSAVAVTGGATHAGTAFAEYVLMKNLLEGAKNLIKKDKEAFCCLEEWLQHCSQFRESVKIADFDIVGHLLEGVQKLKECVSVNDKNGALKYVVVVKFAVDLCAKHSVPVAQIKEAVFAVVALYRLPQLFRLMRDFHKSNPLLYGAIVFTTNSTAFQIARATDVGADTVIAAGVLGGLGVALHVASMVLTSIDIQNGSKSKQADKIREAIKHLESEMTTLTQLNEKLQTVLSEER